jgi:hypothetical protein
MEREHAMNRGAAGLEGEMIDKPMILQVSASGVFPSLFFPVLVPISCSQAEKVLHIARAANLKIPYIDSE